MLDALEGLQSPLRRDACITRTQAHTHYPMQYQRHKTNRRIGSNSLRQAVIYRSNFQLGFQNLEAALNVELRRTAWVA